MNRGVHEIASDAYHADPCEAPSLSASIAHLLCSATPLHAWTAHPKLNPDFTREEKATFDIGTVAHDILLEGIGIVDVVDAADWRTKAAQEARDAARAAGRVPLLASQFIQVEKLIAAIQAQLAEHGADPPLFTDGKAEQTIVWEEPGGVICRARLDWLRTDLQTIDDLKTTSRSASPDAYSRRLFSIGGDVQAAFYRRAVQSLVQGYRASGAPEFDGLPDPEFRWVVAETQPPYAVAVIAPGPDVLTIGEKKVQFAIDAWRKCLRDGAWPGYPSEILYAELPPWEEARWLERELEEAA